MSQLGGKVFLFISTREKSALDYLFNIKHNMYLGRRAQQNIRNTGEKTSRSLLIAED
jgi:hypothetical protein